MKVMDVAVECEYTLEAMIANRESLNMDSANPYAPPQLPASELPTSDALGPPTLLSVLNAGTGLYLRRFPTFAAVTLVVWAPLEIFISYQEYFVLDPDDALSALRLSLMAESLFGIIATAGAVSIGAAAMRGEQRGWLAGLGDGFRAWPRMFGTRFVAGIVLLLAALLFILPALYLAVRYALSETVAVVERKVGMKALERSMELTRGRLLLFFTLCICTVTPIAIAGIVIHLPLAIFPSIDHWLLSAALTCVVDLAGPWMALVFVAAYVQCVEEENREARVSPTAFPDQSSNIPKP